MDPMRYLFRFFRVVPPNPPLMRVALVGTTIAGAVTLAADPGRARDVLTPVLLLQLFASSSGVLVSARRGHYDLLLTMGYSRLRIAVMHWAASAIPGIAACAALAASEMLLARTPDPVLMASGTVVAVLLVSTVPWAVTVALPRFSGAIGWLVILALVMASAPERGHLFDRPADGPSWLQAIIAVLYPPLFVGADLGGTQLVLIAPALLLGGVSLGYALAVLHHRDIPLEAAQ